MRVGRAAARVAVFLFVWRREPLGLGGWVRAAPRTGAWASEGGYARGGCVGGGWCAARARSRSFRIWGAFAPQAPQQGDKAVPLHPLANGPVTGSGRVGMCGRGPRSQAAGLVVRGCWSRAFGRGPALWIALHAGLESTSDVWRGRLVLCCASGIEVASDLGGICPPSPPAGDKAVPYNPSQTALWRAAGKSTRAVVGRGPKLLDSTSGAVDQGVSGGEPALEIVLRGWLEVRAACGVGGGWCAARSCSGSFRIWGARQLGDLAPLVAPQAPTQGASPGEGLHLLDRATREGCPPATPRKRPCNGQRACRIVRSWAAVPSCSTRFVCCRSRAFGGGGFLDRAMRESDPSRCHRPAGEPERAGLLDHHPEGEGAFDEVAE